MNTRLPGRFAADETRILLLKTVPGREADVAKHILAAVRTGEGEESADPRIIYSFGDYDVQVVLQGPHAHAALESAGTIPFILGAREIICTRLSRRPDYADPPVPARVDGGVLATTFITLPGYFTDRRAHSSSLELAFFRWWLDRWRTRPGERPTLFASFGGAEFVLLSTHASIESFYQWIEDLKPPPHLVKRTFSVLGIDFHHLHAPDPLDIGPISRNLTLSFRVSVSQDHRRFMMASAVAAVRSVVGDLLEPATVLTIGTHAGVEDFTLSLRGDERIPLGPVVRALAGFRSLHGARLSNTVTVLKRNEPLESVVGAPPSSPLPDYRDCVPHPRIRPEEAKNLMRLGAIGRAVLRATYAVGNIMQDSVASSAVVDMIPFLRALRLAAGQVGSSGTTEPSAEEVASIDRKLESIRRGVYERIYGANAGMNPIETLVRHSVGGIHRILQAAQLVPLALYDAMVEQRRATHTTRWPGFVSVGSFKDFRCQDDVILLPYASLTNPNRWTNLIHESMHCIVRSYAEHFGPSVEAAARSLEEARSSSGLLARIDRRTTSRDLAWEVLVDVLDFMASPSWTREVWLREHWSYLKDLHGKPGESLVATSLLRVFVVSILGNTRALPAGASHQGFRDRLDAELGSLVDAELAVYGRWNSTRTGGERELGQFVRNQMTKLGVTQWSLIGMIAALRPFLDHFVGTGGPTEDEISDRRRYWETGLERQIAVLERGSFLPPGSIEYPELLLWKAWSHWPRQMPQPAKVAMIGSLLEAYRRKMLVHRDRIRELDLAGRSATPRG